MTEYTHIRKIRQFIQALEEQGTKIDRVIVYGSYGKKNLRRSDNNVIDVAVISPDFGKNRLLEGMFLFRIAAEIEPLLVPTPISSESFERETWIPLIQEIRDNGIEIKFK